MDRDGDTAEAADENAGGGGDQGTGADGVHGGADCQGLGDLRHGAAVQPMNVCSSMSMAFSYSALTALIAACHMVDDALFPICLRFSLIVMYAATGTR